MRNRGFTLIELLIVVAIIAILAAIAVPNFLEAQVRAKVSRVKADQRSIATAIESYVVDYNRSPYYFNTNDGVAFNYSDGDGERTFLPFRLTTPVAYISTLPASPFQPKGWNDADPPDYLPFTYFYRYYRRPGTWVDYTGPNTRSLNAMYNSNHAGKAERLNWCYDCYNHKGFYLEEAQASQIVNWMIASAGPELRCESIQRAMEPQYATLFNDTSYPDLRYDPTNGTVSIGDILRFDANSD